MSKTIVAGLLGLVALLAGPVVAENSRWPREWSNSPVLMETRDVTLVADLPGQAGQGDEAMDYLTLLEEAAQAWADATGFLTFHVVTEALGGCGITTRCVGVSRPEDHPCSQDEWNAAGLYCGNEIAVNPSLRSPDAFFNTAQHEIGHLLGLGHSQIPDTPMGPPTESTEMSPRESIDPMSVCLVTMVFQVGECDDLSVSSVAVIDGSDAGNFRVVMGASNDGGWTYKHRFDPEEELVIYGAVVYLDRWKPIVVVPGTLPPSRGPFGSISYGSSYHAVLAAADGRILARDGETEYVPLDMTNPFPLPVLTGTESSSEGYVTSGTVTRLAGLPQVAWNTRCLGTWRQITSTIRWCVGGLGWPPVFNASLYDLVGQTVYLFMAWSDEDDPLRIFFGTEPLRLEF